MAFRGRRFWFWTRRDWLCLRSRGRRRRWFLACILSFRFCWVRLRELAAARCAMSCWRRFRVCWGGRVCDRSAGAIGRDDRVLQIAVASSVGGGDRRRGLFLAAGDQRVAALEFA